MNLVEDELEQTVIKVDGNILLCAATKWEAGPITDSAGLRAARAARPLTVLKTGVGPINAQKALASVSSPYALVMSLGFAGALQPGIRSGDIVCDVRGYDAALPPLARSIAASLNIPIHFGKITHSDKVLASPAEKRALGQKERASAVDMETQAIRAWAESRGIPVLPVRVVLDAVEDRLPSAVPEGEDFGTLASYALSNFSEIPVMIATGLKQRSAISNLVLFLKELLPKL